MNTNVNTNTNTNTNYNTSVSTSNNTNTNNNNSVVNSTSNNTNNNNSVSSVTSVSTSDSNVNQNVNSNSTSDNTNTNTNNNYSESTSKSEVESKNTNNNRNENINKSETTIKSPPPSAIAPSIGSSYSQDLCTTGISGAVQTQIFGISGGKSVRDMNCERIKLSNTMYDMGMKVAAVSLVCQDERVWQAMRMAGTPCPFEGKIGDEALADWETNRERMPDGVYDKEELPGRLKDDKDLSYQVWTNGEFCEKYPKEEVCK